MLVFFELGIYIFIFALPNKASDLHFIGQCYLLKFSCVQQRNTFPILCCKSSSVHTFYDNWFTVCKNSVAWPAKPSSFWHELCQKAFLNLSSSETLSCFDDLMQSFCLSLIAFLTSPFFPLRPPSRLSATLFLLVWKWNQTHVKMLARLFAVMCSSPHRSWIFLSIW